MRHPLDTLPLEAGEPLSVSVGPEGIILDSLFPVAPPMTAAVARETARRLVAAADTVDAAGGAGRH